MIVYKSGDILQTECDIICQQVNCQNVMGSGLAKSIYKWFPCVKEGYHLYCENKNPYDLLGCVNWITTNTNNERADFVTFANIFGQLNYGRQKVRYTDYDALAKGLEEVFIFASKENKSVAIPYGIGCGLANGDWDIVGKIIVDIYSKYDDVLLEIWKL